MRRRLPKLRIERGQKAAHTDGRRLIIGHAQHLRALRVGLSFARQALGDIGCRFSTSL